MMTINAPRWPLRLADGPLKPWCDIWGPRPDQPGCCAPPELIAKSPWGEMAVEKAALVKVTRAKAVFGGTAAVRAETEDRSPSLAPCPDVSEVSLPPLEGATLEQWVEGLTIRTTVERKRKGRQSYPELFGETDIQSSEG